MDTASLIASAEEAIAENGGPVSIYRLDPTVNLIYPSSSPKQIILSQTLNGVQLNSGRSRTSRFNLGTLDLKTVVTQFFTLSAANLQFIPEPGDVLDNLIGDPMTIIGVDVLRPNGTPLLVSVLAKLGAVAHTFLDLTSALLVSGSDSYLVTSDGSILRYA